MLDQKEVNGTSDVNFLSLHAKKIPFDKLVKQDFLNYYASTAVEVITSTAFFMLMSCFNISSVSTRRT